MEEIRVLEGEYMVRWLQISDLHIRERADWRSFEQELIEKCEKSGKIDFVIVTGDFHDFSEGADFHCAVEFLTTLMDRLGLDMKEDLFLIPGNHDGVTRIDLKGTHIKALRDDPMDSEATESFKALGGAFMDYEKFVQNLIPTYPAEHPAACHVRCWRGQINFIHCNTAIGADGRKKDRQMLNVDELSAVVLGEGKPNIILAHNCFSDMDEAVQCRIKDFIRRHHVRAYLCGDRHRQEVDCIEVDRKRNLQIPCVVSYKSAPDAADHYSEFGIIIGEWTERRAKLQGWLWRSGSGFEDDVKLTGTEICMCGEEDMSESRDTDRIEKDDKEASDARSRLLMHKFAGYYHRMTPHMVVQYNAVYQAFGLALREAYTEKELFDYVVRVRAMGKLEEVTDFLKNLV